MSCSNNPTEKNDKEELTFLSAPVNEYVKLISIFFVAVHLGNITSTYGEINTFAQNNFSFCVFLVFCFFFLNSNYKIEFSMICTVVIMVIFYMLKMLKKNNM
jgi:uncharacterized membrane protein